MSIINVIEDWRERRSVGDVKSGGQEIRVFTVLMDEGDNPIIRPCLAKNAPGVPVYFEQHPADPYCYVQNKVAEAISTTLFKVTVQYGYAEGTSGTGDTNPLAQPDQWSGDFESQNVPIYSAYAVCTLYGTNIGSIYNNNDDPAEPIQNSSGEPQDPPATEQVYDLVKRCVANRLTYDEIFAADMMGSINNDWWKGFPPGTVKLSRFAHEPMQVGTLFYQRWTLEFRVRMEFGGWFRKFLDEGFYGWVGISDTCPTGYGQLTDDKGNPITSPVKLDGIGNVLPETSPPVYRMYRTTKARNFNLIDV